MPHKSTTHPTISPENMKKLAEFMVGGDAFKCPASCDSLRHNKGNITGNTSVLNVGTGAEHHGKRKNEMPLI